MTTTVVGLFEDSRDAHRAVSALLDAGYSRESISLLASDASNEYSRYLNRPEDAATSETEGDDAVKAGEGAGFGAVVGALTGVLVGLTSLAVPGIGPVLAAGPLVGALTGGTVGAVAGAATGGIVAALIKTGISESEAERYAAEVQRGGMLLVVEAQDDRAAFAYDIMREYGAHDSGSNRPLADASTDMQIAGQPEPELDDTQRRAAMAADMRAGAGTTGTEPAAPERGSQDNRSGENVSAAARDAASADADYAAASSSGEGFESFESLDSRYREHFSQTYESLGRRYDQYSPAYRYGYDLATNPRFADADWPAVEGEARRRWEEYNPTFGWMDYEGAVRYAWETSRERTRSR